MRYVPLKPWQVALGAVAAVVFVGLLAALLFWVFVALAVVGAAASLNLWYMPRLARRLGAPPIVAPLAIGVLLLLVGWLAAGQRGLVVTAIAWLVLFGVPHVLLQRLRGRVQMVSVRTVGRPPGPETFQQPPPSLVGVTCPRCDVVSFGGGSCPSCHAALPRPTR